MKAFVFIYAGIMALASFSSIEAQTAEPKNPDLPVFEYKLTEKTEPERINLCDQNKGYCQTNCGGPEKAPKNFCNSTTMGWGCGCIDKVPDYLGYQWPINFAHCIGSGEACKAACDGDSVPAANKPKCNQACIAEYTQKCGTPSQPPAYYNVDDIATIPTYGPPNDTAKTPDGKSPSTDNGSNNKTSTENDAKKNDAFSLGGHIGNAAFILAIVASGMSLL